MMKPHSRAESARVSSRAASPSIRRAHQTRAQKRVDDVVVRLGAEGCPPDEIAGILSGHVAAAMEGRAPDSVAGAKPPLVVDLSAVPLRFSVSAVMALYHLQSAASNPARLGKIVGVSPAAMTGILDTLEGRGLVRRVPDPQDRRRTDVTLTDEGRSLVERMCHN
jgi:predicted transcriptional regulator